MDFGIIEALTYFKEDKSWKKKLLIAYIFAFIYYLVVCFIISDIEKIGELADAENTATIVYISRYFPYKILAYFLSSTIASCFLGGYIIKNINLQIFKPQPMLYEWKNLNDIFFTAIKQLAAVCVYAIVAVLPMCLTVTIFAFLLSAVSGKTLLLIFGFLIALLASFLFLIAVCVYLFTADIIFCTDLKFKSYFNFKGTTKIIKENYKQLIALYLICILVAIGQSLAGAVSDLLHIDLIIVPAALLYAMIVVAKVKANFARYVFEIDSDKE